MIFLVIILRIAYASAELKFVQFVHRHGDRTPIDTYPTDPYSTQIRENGLGQLTTLGKNQLYDLGRYIRSCYNGFLPMEYDATDIYVQSSEIIRTVMSAQFLLAGLYKGNSVSEYFDIPVHVIPASDDNKIVNTASCPRFDELQDDVLENEVSEDKQDRYRESLESLSEFSGLELNYTAAGLNLAASLYDTLNIENNNGLTLPDWTADFYPEPLMEISTFIYYIAPFYTTELKRLRCGPLIKDIFQHFDDVVSGDSQLKMWEYSGHDTTVANVLICLNVFDNAPPPTASAVFLELHQNEDDEFTVVINYKKEDTVETLTIPGCSEHCPLDTLKELASDIIPDDWNEECNS